MTPERWRQVSEIFQAAVAQMPSDRDAFLREACSGDASLREEVDSLLEAHERAGVSEEVPMLGELSPQLEPGARLGPYRVEGLIGAGGMGEVYRATDTRLQRAVAIKVLQPRLIADPAFHSRFEREAQLLAAMNHPNIAGIHGLEDVAGTRALILELVEGAPLDTIIARAAADGGRAPRAGGRRGMELKEALSIARQIALALEAAHAQGIVHRDLKPSNINVAPDGTVKVLDFGIAKVMAAGEPARETTARPRTREGIVLGTAAYMSPEQARGAPIDKRTDIWAFGCVLFEMLTGRRAFEADTASDRIARILECEPDWRLLPPDVPESIQRLLRRCLTKDPVDRLHDVGDARLEIADAATPQLGLVQSPAAGPTSTRRVWAALGLTAAVAIGAWLFWPPLREAPSSVRPIEFGISFPENFVPAHGLAVSPDGRFLAIGVYAATAQAVWLHSFETSETRPLPGAERGSIPFWSPDGSHLAFFGGGALKKQNLANGAVSEICKARFVPYGGTWGAHGTIVFGAGGRLYHVPSTGGEARPISLEHPSQFAGFPQFLPDGRHFLFHSWGPEVGSAHVGSLDSPATRRLVDSSIAAGFSPPDRLLYVRGTTLLAQRLNLSTLQLAGEPEPIGGSAGPGMLNLGINLGAVSTSDNGVLAYGTERGGRPGRLTWFDRSGSSPGSIQTVDDVEFLNPAVSPDGGMVAANRMDPQTGNWDVWVVDVQRNVPTRLTSDPAVDADPIWSPDGKEIVYSSNRAGRLGLYRQSVGSPEAAEPLIAVGDVNVLIPQDWSADGKHILYYQAGTSPWSIRALPLTGDRKPLLVHETAYGGRLSPDGEWVAFSSFESGAYEVYVQRFPNPGAKQRISEGGGVHPRWTSGGRELVYWSLPGGLNAVTLTPSRSGLQVGRPRAILRAPVLSLIDGRTHYDVSRDGQRILARQPAGPPGPGVKVVLNWTARLRKD